ncbi:MAG: class I SAM-dependent methyltransferase [Rubrivivax sp.]|nr:MAG: class I SAM-dependent methyltransferase [Rubrivivax sp.]
MQRTWPLPALLTWLLAWGLCLALRQSQAPAWAALGLPAALGLGLAQWPAVAATRWRSVFVAAGFPVSVLAQALAGGAAADPALAAGATPAWAWLIPLGLLLLAYPVRTWRDAPLFPTPAGALAELAALAPLPTQAQVLDAGCGLGAGLRELRAAYPQAQLHGTEWSWPIALACRLRCPWARVRRGDMWALPWSAFDLVYLFQRPESMLQAMDKARRELKPGAWLVSLEFEAPGWAPVASIRLNAHRQVWLYQPVPAQAGADTRLRP